MADQVTVAVAGLRTIGARLAGADDPWAGMSRRRYGLAGLRRRLDRARAA
jgi:hypothetical protein